VQVILYHSVSLFKDDEPFLFLSKIAIKRISRIIPGISTVAIVASVGAALVQPNPGGGLQLAYDAAN